MNDEEQWEELDVGASQFIDSVGLTEEDEVQFNFRKNIDKSRLTQLRRKAEERRDWKRIDGDYDLECIDDSEDKSYQDLFA